MFTTILALTGMLSGLGALALGWHALSSARVVGSESRALAQRAAAVSASGVDPFAVRDVAVLHYDALEEMSGARSFSLALLNSEGDGVVVTSINGRTESRTYAKAVVGGECDTLLSPEEYRVVRSARLGEGVGAAATAGSPSSRGVSSAGVRPTPPFAAREEPGSPTSRDGERGAREDAEAVDAGPVREWDEAAPAASAVPNGTGATRENVEPAPAGPSARTARATEPVADDSREASEVMPASTSTGASVAPGGDREAPDAAPVFSNATGEQHGAPATGITANPEIPVASEVADDGREDASVAPANPAVRPASTASTTSDAPSVAGEHANAAVTGATAAPGASAASIGASAPGDDREAAEVASATPANPAVRPASTAPSASSNPAVPGGDREEQEPRGLVSVIRRTIGRVGADRRPPVAAVRSGVGAARPIASANVTVRPGPSATAAGTTGTPATGNATAAQPRPEAPAGEETGGEGAREADAPASEARR
ncbi:DUF4446 family protein [Nocardiopsis dassonvillei]|uniref:DUF4446 family protein n=1 Tax=Nocardiopsis dassonvillei TaxID=2014 RepID=UPI00200F7380|nr:DUF4446 family protein [Nocardiopsis dassonvillei]MCK9871955.1 DUF4446 family protein [Nocardiopsis dassonvillei]